jgi:uncharacterized protein
MPDVRDNPDASRFEIVVDGEVAGFIEYRRDGDVVELVHTEIGDAYEGQGLGGKIARGTLDLVRAAGQRVIATCPFVNGWIGKHPEYEDLRAA